MLYIYIYVAVAIRNKAICIPLENAGGFYIFIKFCSQLHKIKFIYFCVRGIRNN